MKMLRNLSAFPLAMILLGCTTFHAPPRGDTEPIQPETSKATAVVAWGRVLKTYVDEQGRVNFSGVATDPKNLHEFVRFVGTYSPESHPQLFPTQEDRLAYYLDSYNALAMYGVIQSGIPEGFNSFFKRASFFKFTEYKIGGKQTNLYDYENDLIRGLGDPRVHFALNCMSIGCPRLPQTAFMAVDLERELDRGAREFFASPKHLRIDSNSKTVYVSEILKFFTEDFVNPRISPNLITYINQYAVKPVPDDYVVEFIPYDWMVNKQ